MDQKFLVILCLFYIKLSICALWFFLSPAYSSSSIVVHGIEPVSSRHILFCGIDWSATRISKNWFFLFYLVGLCLNSCLLAGESFQISSFVHILVWLMQLHFLRRLGESIRWRYSDRSLMNLVHLVCGVVYYVSLEFLIFLCLRLDQTGDRSLGKNLIAYLVGWIGIAGFVGGMVLQGAAHHELGSLKREKSGHRGFPTSWLFSLVYCPHYLAEIIIYFSFLAIIFAACWPLHLVYCLPPLCNLAWVIVNLSISATIRRDWYRHNYPREFYANSRRKAVIPFAI